MGLLIHELVTNSVKFGALSQPLTQLRVIWWFASELHGEGEMIFLSEGVLCTTEFPVGEALLQYE